MRGFFLFVAGVAVALVVVWLASCNGGDAAGAASHGFSSFDAPRGAAAALQFDTGKLNLTNADLETMLKLYQDVSARTVIRSPDLQEVKISLVNETPLTRVETLQLLDTTLVQNGVTMVLVGDTAVKAVPNREVVSETPPSIDLAMDELPDSSSYMTCTVQLKEANPQQAVQMLVTASRLQNNIMYMPAGKLLILRDYSANIKRMLGLLDQADRVPLPWEGMFGGKTNNSGKGR